MDAAGLGEGRRKGGGHGGLGGRGGYVGALYGHSGNQCHLTQVLFRYFLMSPINISHAGRQPVIQDFKAAFIEYSSSIQRVSESPENLHRCTCIRKRFGSLTVLASLEIPFWARLRPA